MAMLRAGLEQEIAGFQAKRTLEPKQGRILRRTYVLQARAHSPAIPKT
jgi:hypothetical protein